MSSLCARPLEALDRCQEAPRPGREALRELLRERFPALGDKLDSEAELPIARMSKRARWSRVMLSLVLLATVMVAIADWLLLPSEAPAPMLQPRATTQTGPATKGQEPPPRPPAKPELTAATPEPTKATTHPPARTNSERTRPARSRLRAFPIDQDYSHVVFTTEAEP